MCVTSAVLALQLNPKLKTVMAEKTFSIILLTVEANELLAFYILH